MNFNQIRNSQKIVNQLYEECQKLEVDTIEILQKLNKVDHLSDTVFVNSNETRITSIDSMTSKDVRDIDEYFGLFSKLVATRQALQSKKRILRSERLNLIKADKSYDRNR